ncbi:TlpA disulfide reductase family protein [Winogradskyella sp.]|uniref:TlpA family protein disulfide reductase n=1 Tax=Winogradskyella sp. TaxID=1883156 RepID=UPI001B082D6D|nr:TlpA disulfide reductase family protein [Winogradskyella sp.]MBO6880610.1 thioredoxin family protein [Winogradskyella sp.]
MKHIHVNIILIVLVMLLGCNTETPTTFSEAAMNDTFISLEGESVQFKDIIKQYEGKQIVIDVWATWCRDCIEGMPKVKKLQKKFPDATFLFLSLDRKQELWKKGIDRFKVEGEHYYMQSGWDGPFGDFLDLDWIPRYMVVDAEGNIKLFKAIEADDKNIIEVLK